jgi:ubiquinone/menaquinone biosynthesis C-methylase UbiE
MLGVRDELCFQLSRRLIKPPSAHTENYDAYSDWRQTELESQWRFFSNDDIRNKDVLDFGSGFGNLTFYLAKLGPKSIIGLELEPFGIEQAEKIRAKSSGEYLDRVRFMLGQHDRIPLPDQSIDTLLAFDCLEHITQPETILREFHRVLRPGGKVLAWWSPYRGPWGPHMDAVVPIPWAHVLFGERAMLRTAARIYELDSFVPRPWHFNEDGSRKPNVWKQWSSFREQGYINQMTVTELREHAERANFRISRLEPHGFSGNTLRRTVGGVLARLPVLGEWMTSFYIVECVRGV